MDVLVRLLEGEAAAFDLRGDLAQPTLGGRELLFVEKARSPQPASVGDGSGNVVGSQVNVDF
jgi:hypothetical protein